MATCTGLLQTKIYCEYAGGRCYGHSSAAVATVYSYFYEKVRCFFVLLCSVLFCFVCACVCVCLCACVRACVFVVVVASSSSSFLGGDCSALFWVFSFIVCLFVWGIGQVTQGVIRVRQMNEREEAKGVSCSSVNGEAKVQAKILPEGRSMEGVWNSKAKHILTI